MKLSLHEGSLQGITVDLVMFSVRILNMRKSQIRHYAPIVSRQVKDRLTSGKNISCKITLKLRLPLAVWRSAGTRDFQ